MAILRDFGKSENDLGVWFPFGEADPTPFEVRVRRIPYDVAQRISKRYGREVMSAVDGVRRPSIERTIEETTKWLLDQASWAWVDARGLEIEVADAEASRLWSGILKQEAPVGSTVDLSGAALTHDAKLRILTQIRPYAPLTSAEGKREQVDLASFIVIKAALLQTEASKSEEAARGN